jgi:hypothetical protein
VASASCSQHSLPWLSTRASGEPIPGSWPAAERRLAFVDGRAGSVVDAKLGDGAVAVGPAAGEPKDERRQPWRDLGPDQAHYRAVGGRDRSGAVGEAKHEAADWPALGLVGVEQRRVGQAPVDERQLPAEVPGVLDAGVHALGAGWAVHVGGVAGEKDTAGAVVDGLAVMKQEVRQPHRVAQAQLAAGEPIGDRLQVGQRGLGQLLLLGDTRQRRPHADHAPTRRPAERKEEQHPRPADEGMRGVAVEAADLEVAQRERLRIRAALERNPRQATDAAPGAVAPGHVAGTDLLAAPALMAERAGDLVFVRREGDKLHTPLDPNPAGGQVLVQHGLGLGLRDEEQERVGGVLEPDVEKPRPHDPLAEVHLQLDGVVASLDQPL